MTAIEGQPPVIVVTSTVMSGQVVRWYRSEAEATYGGEVLSASRDGVIVLGFLTNIPDPWVAAAVAAYQTLSRNRGADLGHLATHRRIGFLSERVEPVPAVQP